MVTSTVTTFENSLERLDVGWTRASVDELHDAFERVCTTPAIGTPLPFDGATLPDWVNDDPTPADLREASSSITAAGIGIAEYGTVVLPSTPDGSEPVSLFSDVHVPVVRASDVVPGMPEAFARLGEEFRTGEHSSAILATGPSATADMGALVRGAHGPKEVHVVIVDE